MKCGVWSVEYGVQLGAFTHFHSIFIRQQNTEDHMEENVSRFADRAVGSLPNVFSRHI